MLSTGLLIVLSAGGLVTCRGVLAPGRILPVAASTQARLEMATNLDAKTECSHQEPRKGIARLSWQVAARQGSEQRIAVTIYRDGFETGKFERTGPLLSNQSSFLWDRLDPGIIHYYRVLTLHTDGWVASETASFEAPICVADFQPKQGPQ